MDLPGFYTRIFNCRNETWTKKWLIECKILCNLMPKILEIANKLHIIVLLLLTCSGPHFLIDTVNHIVRSSLLIWSFQRIYIFFRKLVHYKTCVFYYYVTLIFSYYEQYALYHSRVENNFSIIVAFHSTSK